MATPSPQSAAILAMLREGRFTCEQIAQALGISVNVVYGVNSHYRRGRYTEKPKRPAGTGTGRTVRTDRGWTYLLVSRCGVVYIGATTNLRNRFRSHNAATNTGWTRGRRWHLLGAVRFASRAEAFDLESRLKRSGKARGQWLEQCLARAARLERRFGLGPAWLRGLAERAGSLQRHAR
ncbi:GIY-YIG nuclease family protein [Pseudorhodoferax sp.]|uniref:GIY-YIG nuclease family protein n=1 Tax=Pseudorhodoferax sp. TaxID=1993553 RepID=UPI0039E33485